ncbi:MAG: flavin reductase family protein [Burkholderiales bacterium]
MLTSPGQTGSADHNKDGDDLYMTNVAMEDRACMTNDIASVEPARFLGAIRYFAAGCTIIATSDGTERAGLTATAVCSVTAEPPRLLVCINRQVRAHAIILDSGTLSVNVLSEAQENLANRFAGMVKDIRGEERFLEGEWVAGRLGAPILAGSLASFDCRIVEAVPASTHTIFICEVLDVASDGDAAPLLFFNRAFAALDKPTNPTNT